MEKIEYGAKYFNPLHTLDCGQIFRFDSFKDGFIVFSGEKACYLHTDGVKTVAECEDGEYFYNFFDLARDYSEIAFAQRGSFRRAQAFKPAKRRNDFFIHNLAKQQYSAD